MDTEYSTALASLRSDPLDPVALETLNQLHPGNGSGVDPDVLGAALTAARAWHEEHGDVALCVQLLDVVLAWTTPGPHRADLLVVKARLLAHELMRWEPAR